MWKSRLERARTAPRSRRSALTMATNLPASPTTTCPTFLTLKPPAKDRPRSPFTMCSKAMLPTSTSLADQYTMSDNFHQSFIGGTGPNHIMFGHADALWFSDGQGNPAEPPNNVRSMKGYETNAGVVTKSKIQIPHPRTNNWYSEDGYGRAADTRSPAGLRRRILQQLRRSHPARRWTGRHLSEVHRRRPTLRARPLLSAEQLQPWAISATATMPTLTTIRPTRRSRFRRPRRPASATNLNANGISWKYYGDQWNNYVPDPYQLNYGINGPNADEYCNICNPFQYDTAIMSNPAQVAAHMQDVVNLYSDIATGTLPAVSITKPSGYIDGHPVFLEAQRVRVVHARRSWIWSRNSPYWDDTAIFITFDEGGGYYDSGYVQPVDFFGDGTRIPLLVISKYSTGGHVNARLCRPRVDRQIHREELEHRHHQLPQPGQLPQPDHEKGQPLCSG